MSCRGCIYSFYVDGHLLGCGYLLTTGKRRLCPPGEGCTVKKAKGRKRMAKKLSFDPEMAQRLLDDGLTIAEAAESLGVNYNTLRSWASRRNRQAKPEADPSQEQADAAPVQEESQSKPPWRTVGFPAIDHITKDPFQLTEDEARVLYKLVARSYVGPPIEDLDDLRELAKVASFFARMDLIFREEG